MLRLRHIRTVTHIAVLLSSFFICSKIIAGLKPSFYLEAATWRATDIVIADEGEKIDGEFKVTEVLKGKCKIGESINIPALSVFASKNERRVIFDLRPKERKYVSYTHPGKKALLFLKRSEIIKDNQKTTHWLPAGKAKRYGGFQTSIAWIDNQKIIAFTQCVNPGGSLPTIQESNVKQVKKHILDSRLLQLKLIKISILKDKNKKAKKVLSLVPHTNIFVQNRAFDILIECKAAALPGLRSLLSKDNLSSLHSDIIEAMSLAGGKSVSAEFTELLKEEIQFWNRSGPKLKPGWWNGENNDLKWEEVEILRDRYVKLAEILRALKRHPTKECIKDIRGFKNFWISNAALNDGGLKDIIDLCSELLPEKKNKRK